MKTEYRLKAAILGNAYEWRFAIKELPGAVWWDKEVKCWHAECTTFDKVIAARFEQRLQQLERVGLIVKRLTPGSVKNGRNES